MKTIGIDMGGVIKVDSGEEEIPGSLDALRLLKKSYQIFIFTTHPDIARSWLERHAPDLLDLEITNIKHPATAYIDDLGIRFTSWEDILKLLLKLRSRHV